LLSIAFCQTEQVGTLAGTQPGDVVPIGVNKDGNALAEVLLLLVAASVCILRRANTGPTHPT